MCIYIHSVDAHINVCKYRVHYAENVLQIGAQIIFIGGNCCKYVTEWSGRLCSVKRKTNGPLGASLSTHFWRKSNWSVYMYMCVYIHIDRWG